jgi:hypothetical protein
MRVWTDAARKYGRRLAAKLGRSTNRSPHRNRTRGPWGIRRESRQD